MLNLSNIVSRIRFKLGIATLALPFEQINNQIVEIIQDFTVPVFSLYCPDRKVARVNPKESFELFDKQSSYVEFLIPFNTNFKCLYINDIYYYENVLSNITSYEGIIPVGIDQSPFINHMILGNLSAQLINQAIPKMTFDYKAPRNLKLFNAYWSYDMMFDWSFEHSKSLNTIPDDALNSFLDLALLDVKENLYPTLAAYVEQNTRYGTIRLPIETWANAESERKELLSHWDDVYHLDGIPFWYG